MKFVVTLEVIKASTTSSNESIGLQAVNPSKNIMAKTRKYLFKGHVFLVLETRNNMKYLQCDEKNHLAQLFIKSGHFFCEIKNE